MATKRTKPGPVPAVGQPRDRVAMVRLTTGERDLYARAAAAEGCSLAEWLRRAAEERIGRAERLVAALGRGRGGEEGR